MDPIALMDRNLQESLFEASRKIYPHLADLFVLDASGNFFAGNTDLPLAEHSTQSFLQNLMRSQTPR